MTRLPPLGTAVPLVAALAVVACGGGADRPEPPSPPPIQTESVAAPARPEPASHPAAPAEIDRGTDRLSKPVEPAPVDAAPVEPAPVARTEDAEPVADAPAPPDPLQWMEDRKAREEAARVRLASAEQAVEDAKARVAELESRLLAVKNPFLPRPTLPPEEAAAWEGLDGVARAKRVEEQLVEARAELDRAEKALAALRSR